MLKQIEQLKERLEISTGTQLSNIELEYLEKVHSVNDIGSFDHNDEKLVSLAYDVAVALGLSKTNALVATGEIPAEHARVINLSYHDGEYLSGYELYGDEAKMMERIGLAKYISGWGYNVSDAVVKKLGTNFEFRAAWEMAQPTLNAKRDFERMEKERVEKIFSEAKHTGFDQVLESYSEECSDPREECDIDNVTVYARPDGSKKIVRSHTW